MENQVDVQPESSPALEVPRDGAAYAEWRQTGKLPEAKPAQPKGESAPPKESSAEGEKPKEKAAPVSETGKQDQERQRPPRDNAATRLTELLEDLRKAGLTPAELKTYKREAQKAAEQVRPFLKGWERIYLAGWSRGHEAPLRPPFYFGHCVISESPKFHNRVADFFYNRPKELGTRRLQLVLRVFVL